MREAGLFSKNECRHDEPSLFGVTDGKAVGTYIGRVPTSGVGAVGK
jgi:hypothetical protein